MFKSKAKVSFKGLTKLRKKLNTLDGSKITVGYYSNQRHPTIGIPMSELAYLHENGGVSSKGNNIPQRDFMTQSWENYIKGYSKSSTAKVVNDYLFNNKKLRECLNKQGEEVKWMINWTVEVGGDFVPNHPKTLANKVGNDPLIDSGYLKNNATVKVTFNGK